MTATRGWKKRLWTERDDAVLRENAHLGVRRLCALLDRRPGAVNGRACTLRVRLGRCAARRSAVTPEGFLERVEFDTNGGCWIWAGGQSSDGYGAVSGYTASRRAHRRAWEFWRGPIPDGLQVCHRCDVPLCVNPDHLFLGTNTDNMRDMAAKGRGRAPRGSAHYSAVLSEDDAANILALRGVVQLSDMARVFGSTLGNISAVTKRSIWKHVSAAPIERAARAFWAKCEAIGIDPLGLVPATLSGTGEMGRHKLTWTKVDAIREDRRPQAVVGVEYGVSGRLVWMIRNGRAWRPETRPGAHPLADLVSHVSPGTPS